MSTIAIDALGISQPGGGRSATMNVLRELLRLDTSNRYHLLLDQPEPALVFPGDRVQQMLVPVRHRLLSRLWAQVTWPIILRRLGVNLVHHIKNLSALGLPGRSVVTVYDLAIVLHPDIYPFSDVFYWRFVQPNMLRAADRVIAISQQTARDLVRLYGLAENAIQVIYPAYAPRFHPASEMEVERAREHYGTGPHYLLHVGSLSRKKNLLTLVGAYERLRQRGYGGKLVLVGRQYGKGYDRQFFEHLEASPYRSGVLLTGAVPDEDLPALYSGAELTVFPSLHEGFGIVALEAMACGTPVITSNAGALPEVVGEGGMTIEDATDVGLLTEAAERLLSDRALRERAVARGLEWVKRYSVTAAAKQTLALYDQLLGS